MRLYVCVWATVIPAAVLYICELIKPARSMAPCVGNCTDPCIYIDGDPLRNNSDFKKFENCTAIEGGLKIFDFQKSSAEVPLLPKLREISGYLLIYQTERVVSLADLFPNLTVIRGDNPLDGNFSLVISQVHELRSIKLQLAILNGSVFIINNEDLCYVEDINWRKYSPTSQVVLRNNKPRSLCNSADGEYHTREEVEILDNVKYFKNNHTWPSPRNVTCHRLCLGGCTGPTAADCYVCRTLQHKGVCVDTCPRNAKFIVNGRRCVDQAGCHALSPRWNVANSRNPVFEDHPVFEVKGNSCVQMCPEPYTSYRDYGFLKCRLHQERSTCDGRTISHIADIPALNRCVKINGTLEIKFSRCGNYSFAELESVLREGLGQIKEIRDSLHIVRAHGIQNLSFLKNLIAIRNLDPAVKYALLIDDNASLSKLFTSDENKDLKINGTVVIHNNPLLCQHEVHKLKNIALNGSDTLLLDSNNGQRAQCAGSALELKLEDTSASSALVTWKSKENLTMSYSTVYYRPAVGNVSRFSLTVPSEDYWEATDIIGSYSVCKYSTHHALFAGCHVGEFTFVTNIAAGEMYPMEGGGEALLKVTWCDMKDHGQFLINGLKPGTNYAVYIQIVGDVGVLRKSEIKDFRTKPKLPDEGPCIVAGWPYPSLFTAIPSMKIEWVMPESSSFNRDVIYLVQVEYIEDEVSPCSLPEKLRGQTNVTSYNATLQKYRPNVQTLDPRRRQLLGCCSDFSETLQSVVKQNQRSLQQNPAPHAFPLNNTGLPHQPQRRFHEFDTSNHTDSKGRLLSFSMITTSEAKVVKNLVPFGEYRIKVYLCLLPPGGDPRHTSCTFPAFGAGRASALKRADRFLGLPKAVDLEEQTAGKSSFLLTWSRSDEASSSTWYDVVVKNNSKIIQKHCSDKTEIKIEVPVGECNVCVTVKNRAQTGDTKCILYRGTRSSKTHGWRNFFLILFGGSSAATICAFAIRRFRRRSGGQIALQGLLQDPNVFRAQYSDLPDQRDEYPYIPDEYSYTPELENVPI